MANQDEKEKAAKAEAEKAEAEKAEAEKAEAEKAKKAEKKGPCVAKGRSVSCKRGIVGELEPISPDDLAGGKDAFNALVKAGIIEK